MKITPNAMEGLKVGPSRLASLDEGQQNGLPKSTPTVEPPPMDSYAYYKTHEGWEGDLCPTGVDRMDSVFTYKDKLSPDGILPITTCVYEAPAQGGGSNGDWAYAGEFPNPIAPDDPIIVSFHGDLAKPVGMNGMTLQREVRDVLIDLSTEFAQRVGMVKNYRELFVSPTALLAEQQKEKTQAPADGSENDDCSPDPDILYYMGSAAGPEIKTQGDLKRAFLKIHGQQKWDQLHLEREIASGLSRRISETVRERCKATCNSIWGQDSSSFGFQIIFTRSGTKPDGTKIRLVPVWVALADSEPGLSYVSTRSGRRDLSAYVSLAKQGRSHAPSLSTPKYPQVFLLKPGDAVLGYTDGCCNIDPSLHQPQDSASILEKCLGDGKDQDIEQTMMNLGNRVIRSEDDAAMVVHRIGKCRPGDIASPKTRKLSSLGGATSNKLRFDLVKSIDAMKAERAAVENRRLEFENKHKKISDSIAAVKSLAEARRKMPPLQKFSLTDLLLELKLENQADPQQLPRVIQEMKNITRNLPYHNQDQYVGGAELAASWQLMSLQVPKQQQFRETKVHRGKLLGVDLGDRTKKISEEVPRRGDEVFRGGDHNTPIEKIYFVFSPYLVHPRKFSLAHVAQTLASGEICGAHTKERKWGDDGMPGQLFCFQDQSSAEEFLARQRDKYSVALDLFSADELISQLEADHDAPAPDLEDRSRQLDSTIGGIRTAIAALMD